MPAKYQVFISSTYEDLQAERDQVIKAVLEMGHIPVGMEMFSAADDEQWRIITRHIDESDYYVAIVAHRYGSVTEDGLSFTQKEYEYARAHGIPCLGFLIGDSALWPTNQVDTDPGKKRSLDAFKELVREKPVGFWNSADDLHAKFSIALVKAITANPREGWVRASTVTAIPGMTEELVRLSTENASLRERLDAAHRAAVDDEHVKQQRVFRATSGSIRKPSYRYADGGGWQHDADASLLRVFLILGPVLTIEASVNQMAGNLAMEIRTDKTRRWDIVATNHIQALMVDLMALDLVAPSNRKHAVSDSGEYWRLTPFGLEMQRRLRVSALIGTGEEDETVDGPRSDDVADVADGDSSDLADGDVPQPLDLK
jgi:hypothetical protein